MRTTIAIVVLATLAGMPCPVHAGSQEILHGSVAVDAAAYRSYLFNVTDVVARVHDARVEGHLVASGGSGNDIIVSVMTETQFINWKNNHQTPALYSSGKVTALDVEAPIGQPGTYYLVFDNTFSALTPKTVEGDLRLVWTDPRGERDAASGTAADDSLTTVEVVVLVLIVAAIAAGGATVGAWVASRKRKRA